MKKKNKDILSSISKSNYFLNYFWRIITPLTSKPLQLAPLNYVLMNIVGKMCQSRCKTGFYTLPWGDSWPQCVCAISSFYNIHSLPMPGNNLLHSTAIKVCGDSKTMQEQRFSPAISLTLMGMKVFDWASNSWVSANWRKRINMRFTIRQVLRKELE